MILGIGTDIFRVSRIESILSKYENKFVTRILGERELSAFNKKKINYSLYLGKRFAAKEAFWKAISPVRGEGLYFKEIEILNDLNGKPYFFFSGKTKKYIKKLENKFKSKLKYDISISDEPPFVIAFVVISLAPFA